jgi:hypothetical protein
MNVVCCTLWFMLCALCCDVDALYCSIYTVQSGWTIPDHMLRSAVKRVIKDDLLGTYQDFLRRWGGIIPMGWEMGGGGASIDCVWVGGWGGGG